MWHTYSNRVLRVLQCPETPNELLPLDQKIWNLCYFIQLRGMMLPSNWWIIPPNGVASKSHLGLEYICRIRLSRDCGYLGPIDHIIIALAVSECQWKEECQSIYSYSVRVSHFKARWGPGGAPPDLTCFI